MAQSTRPPLTTEQSKRDHAIKQSARDAALQVGPRVYTITGIPDAPVKILALGCQGEGNAAQKQTAKLMNDTVKELISRGEAPPILAIYDGDNLYSRGTLDPLDPKFRSHHHDIYYDPELDAINNIPSIVGLGNHDGNYDEIAKLPAAFNLVSQGEVYEINQAARNYLDHSADHPIDNDMMLDLREKMVAARTKLFMQDNIHISELTRWVMPYFYFSLVLRNTQIFILNSNNFVKDFLLSTTKQTRDGYNNPDSEDGKRVNQFEWFMREYTAAVAANRQIFIVEHIPQVVCGKRSFPNKFDATHFLWKKTELPVLNAELAKLDPAHVYTESYNELQVSIFRLMNIKPHLFICAHEHFLSWLNEYKLADGTPMAPQFTTGGGGGKLQHRESFRNHPFVGMQQSHNGFGLIECNYPNSKSFTLDVFTVEGLCMRFKESSAKPVIEVVPEDMAAVQLQLAVQETCDEFLNLLKGKELNKQSSGSYLAWGFSTMAFVATSAVELYRDDPEDHKRDHEINHLQDLQAFFNQRVMPDFKTGMKFLHERAEQLPRTKSKYLAVPLYVMLENKLRTRLQKNFKELFEESGIVLRKSFAF